MYLECIKNALYYFKAKVSKLIVEVMYLECINNTFIVDSICIIFS